MRHYFRVHDEKFALQFNSFKLDYTVLISYSDSFDDSFPNHVVPDKSYHRFQSYCYTFAMSL